MSKVITITTRFSPKKVRVDNPVIITTGSGSSSGTASSHDPVTIGTANGLSIAAQVLSLATATTSAAGAMSAADKTKLNAIQSGAINQTTADSLYEPKFSKNTAFNKNFGTTEGTVAEGIHSHNGVVVLKNADVDNGHSINLGGSIIIEGGTNVTVGRVDNKFTINATGGVTGITEINESSGIQVTTSGTERTISARIDNNTLKFEADGEKMRMAVDPLVVALKSDLHSAVTLGTANGLSLNGQQLSLAAATTSAAGAMSASDKTKLNSSLTSSEIAASYEPIISPKGTAFNANFGTTSGTVAAGNHTHSQLHDAVTIGTSNGLSLVGQQLSLANATTSVSGAMSAADKTKLNGVQSNAINQTTADGRYSLLGHSHPNLFTLKAEDADTGQAIGQGDSVILKGGQNVALSRTSNAITIDVSVPSAGITAVYEGPGVQVTPSGTTRTVSTRIDNDTIIYDPLDDSTMKVDTSKVALKTDLHNAVSIGTANGLSLNGQQISLAAATTITNGAMLAGDKQKLDGVAVNADNYGSWKLNDGTIGGGANVASGTEVNFLGSGAATVSRSGNDITIDVPAASGVTGTGTSGRAARWTGTSSLGNSALYDNGTNVAIGASVSSSYRLYATQSTGYPVIRGYNSASTTSGAAGVMGETNGAGQGYLSRYDGTRRAAVYGAAGTGGSNYAGYFSGDVLASGDVYSNSDSRLKKNVRPIENPLERLMEVNPVAFNWIGDEKGRLNYGVIAQELQKVLPELVAKDGAYLTVRYQEFIGVIIAAMQEQQRQIESQEKRLDNIEKQLKKLKDGTSNQ